MKCICFLRALKALGRQAQMDHRSRVKYSWIIDQLTGIRSLETQLSHVLSTRGKARIRQIRRGMTELELRLALLDRALNAPDTR